MNNVIPSGYVYNRGLAGFLANAYGTAQAGTLPSSFLDLVVKGCQSTSEPSAAQKLKNISGISEAAASPATDAYLKHLESKYGKVTIEDVGRDRESLEKVGKRMSGSDVFIAPNMLEKMAGDPEIAAYYEKKIDDFFEATPRLKAHFAAQGLTYEPCGVVVHKDGSVTYICGGGDTPERVAEVNRINRERDAKRAQQRKLYFEQSAAAAEQRRALWERSAKAKLLEDSVTELSDLLKMRMSLSSSVLPQAIPQGNTDLFFLDI